MAPQLLLAVAALALQASAALVRDRAPANPLPTPLSTTEQSLKHVPNAAPLVKASTQQPPASRSPAPSVGFVFSSVSRGVTWVSNVGLVFSSASHGVTWAEHALVRNLRGKSVAEQQPQAENSTGETQGTTGFSFFIYAVLVSVLAYFYHEKKRPAPVTPASSAHDFSKWTTGIFDVFTDMDLFLWSFACPYIRWAETMSMTRLLPFWLAFAICVGTGFFNMLTFGITYWLGFALIFAFFRRRLRTLFQMQVDMQTTLEDVALYCCCSWCAIMQEAHHVEEASAANKIPADPEPAKVAEPVVEEKPVVEPTNAAAPTDTATA